MLKMVEEHFPVRQLASVDDKFDNIMRIDEYYLILSTLRQKAFTARHWESAAIQRGVHPPPGFGNGHTIAPRSGFLTDDMLIAPLKFEERQKQLQEIYGRQLLVALADARTARCAGRPRAPRLRLAGGHVGGDAAIDKVHKIYRVPLLALSRVYRTRPLITHRSEISYMTSLSASSRAKRRYFIWTSARFTAWGHRFGRD
jgi:hypothetical protein